MNERKKQIQLAVEKFISLVRDYDGVIEVALFGSAASDKPNPQDFDLMVFIENIACIPHISKSVRKTTNIFHAHDVFIFDERNNYLGRICQRSVCPTTSVECYVKDCGKIKYLKQLERFVFDERKALKIRPVTTWQSPHQKESLSQQWFNALSILHANKENQRE
ncbi:MAG: nucleotidyltransferase domain-containing protein [Candidatus Methanoperedens sp.]|nr:nucleotidyltransferase domain-containing protein [Candidatus Methanoperedens sp.]